MSKSTQISFGQGMGMVAEAAPTMLLVSMLGCFAFIGYTQYLFYAEAVSYTHLTLPTKA